MVWDHDPQVQLLELQQGSDSAADYAVKFRTLAAQSGWTDSTFQVVFRDGFSPVMQVEMVFKDLNSSLSEYITTAVRLDNLLWQRFSKLWYSWEYLPCEQFRDPREETPEPMQLVCTGVPPDAENSNIFVFIVGA
ncbi:hypothetical protein QTP86_025254 [Hemibagrus guttatus]|nr:hypothetical protein QTP86_025254 [Hemibagrus guttatus]